MTSRVDTGTTFHILLPCAETAELDADCTGSRTGSARLRQGATVLVVEDEDLLRLALSAMLRQTGFEVFEAADGLSAIELLRANGAKIDVMLLDITVPGASSPEIVAEAAKARPDIRVIFSSAYGQNVIAEAMNVAQIHDFIRKPFRVADLMKKLLNILSL